MPYLILIVCLVIALLLGGRVLLTSSPATLAQVLRLTVAFLIGFFALFFLLVERLVLAVPLGAVALLLFGGGRRGTVLRLLWRLRGLLGGGAARWPGGNPAAGRAPGGGRSEVRTEWLAMSLDHATGDMQGEVLRGSFSGRKLADLDLQQLLVLLADCTLADQRAALLLESFLDRQFGDRWRAAAAAQSHAGASGPGQSSGGNTAGASTVMSRQEAYEVLGLAPGATAEAIQAAHRRLMMKLHPDHGGSDYLASKINEAKDLLLQS